MNKAIAPDAMNKVAIPIRAFTENILRKGSSLLLLFLDLDFTLSVDVDVDEDVQAGEVLLPFLGLRVMLFAIISIIRLPTYSRSIYFFTGELLQQQCNNELQNTAFLSF
jgi:hypothetical protein